METKYGKVAGRTYSIAYHPAPAKDDEMANFVASIGTVFTGYHVWVAPGDGDSTINLDFKTLEEAKQYITDLEIATVITDDLRKQGR